MANAYTWQFPALDVYPNYQGLTDAVYAVHWRLTGNDGSGHVATAYGVQGLGAIDLQNFIPFANLTFSQVQGWVEEQMGSSDVAKCKSVLDQNIAEQVSPSRQTKLPPWS